GRNKNQEEKMAKKKKARAVRAPSTAVEVRTKERKPKREVIEIHTTRESTRNASGVLGDKGGTIATVLGGVGAASAAVIASQKWGAHPSLIAGATAAAGLAAMSMGKQPWLRQAGAGAVVGAAVFGAVPMVVDALSGKKSEPQVAQA